MELGEVESRLTTHPAVHVAAAVVVGDLAGARLTAYVSTIEGHDVNPAEPQAHAADTLPEHMVPSSVQLL